MTDHRRIHAEAAMLYWRTRSLSAALVHRDRAYHPGRYFDHAGWSYNDSRLAYLTGTLPLVRWHRATNTGDIHPHVVRRSWVL